MSSDIMKILGLAAPPDASPDASRTAQEPLGDAQPTGVVSRPPDEDPEALRPVSRDVERLHLDADYIASRNNSRQLSHTADLALQGILDIATSSGSPRAYEVVAMLLKNANEINQSLMDLHTKRQKLREEEEEDEGPKGGTHIDRAIVFQGNSRDLLRLAKELVNPEIPVVETAPSTDSAPSVDSDPSVSAETAVDGEIVPNDP